MGSEMCIRDRKKLGLGERFIVSYIGTLGLAHGLSTVLEVAGRLGDQFPEIFLFVGEGADKEQLISEAKKRGLSNVIFLPQQPREKVPSIIRASDICLVLLRKADVFKTVIPTKMLEFMACGRPVILGVDGQARQVLERAQAGIFVRPEDPEELSQAILHLYKNDNLRESFGRNGRTYILNHLSREQTAKDYLTLLHQFTQAQNPSTS